MQLPTFPHLKDAVLSAMSHLASRFGMELGVTYSRSSHKNKTKKKPDRKTTRLNLFCMLKEETLKIATNNFHV